MSIRFDFYNGSFYFFNSFSCFYNLLICLISSFCYNCPSWAPLGSKIDLWLVSMPFNLFLTLIPFSNIFSMPGVFSGLSVESSKSKFFSNYSRELSSFSYFLNPGWRMLFSWSKFSVSLLELYVCPFVSVLV